MDSWQLALLGLGTLAGVAAVVHAVISQLMARIDRIGEMIQTHVDQRFTEAEGRRADASTHWRERYEQHTRDIQQIRHDLSQHCQLADDRYVTMDRYIETDGRAMVQMAKIREALEKLTRQEPPSA